MAISPCVHPVETVLTLLVLTTLLALFARKLGAVPTPITMVVGGGLIAFVPGLPHVTLDPQIVFLLFLPPLLYAAAYFTSWRDFKHNLTSISLLAIGLVLATTAAVGYTLHYFVPSIPLTLCFLLGAIVSPPDAVAASAIAHRMHLPRSIVSILEGESLVNDATGLVLYKLALAAVLSGAHVTFASASLDFLKLAAGGLVLGTALGFLFVRIQRFFEDPVLATTASLLISFGTYIVAEHLHLSGVLAVVAAGLVQGRCFPLIGTSEIRLHATNVWRTVIFLLEALAFVLIGLQLPEVVTALREYPTALIVKAALAATGAAILVRLVWMFPGAYLPRFLFPRFRKTHPYPPATWVLITGWSGMRGVVSLAAALALPLTLPSGEPFPARSLLIFLTFCVILGTLVIQGGTLPLLIRLLEVADDGSLQEEQKEARLALTEAALVRVDTVAEEKMLGGHQVHPVRNELMLRLRALTRVEAVSTPASKDARMTLLLKREAIEAQRTELARMRRSETIGDETFHALQQELDIDEMRFRRG